MIKVFGLEVCPDCVDIKEQIKDKTNEFEYFDIASKTSLMKEYLKLRDTNSVFDDVKKNNKIGIPYFVLEDGTVTLNPEEVGLKGSDAKTSCSLEDHINGVKGC